MSDAVDLGAGYISLGLRSKGLGTEMAQALGASVGGAADKAGAQATGSFQKMSSVTSAAFLKLGGIIATAFAFDKIAGGFKVAVDRASDLQEAGTAISAVFGSADEGIQEWARNAATSLGTSTLSALQAAQSFGVYGRQAGLADDANREFSTGLVGLGTDLASFYNSSPEEAIAAIGAGLRGEAEPLRRFGILLDDATLRAKALEMGLYDGSGSLTQQQRILAAHAVIMEQAGVAAGDFAKTSDGLANQQRISAALWENISGKIGSLFLPGVLAATTALNTSLLPAVDGAVDWLGNRLAPALAGVFGFFAKGDSTFDLASAFQVDPNSPAIGFFLQLREGIQSVIGILSSAFGPAFAAIGEAFAPLIPQLLELWSSFSPISIIFGALGPMLPQLAAAFAQLATTLGTALGGAMQQLLPALQPLVTALTNGLGIAISAILPVITQLAGMLGPIFASILGQLAPLFVVLAGVLGEVFAAVMPLIGPILDLVAPLLELVMSILSPLIEMFAALLGPLLALIVPLIKLVEPILELVAKLLKPLIQLFTELANAVIKPLTSIIIALLPPILGVVNAIATALIPIVEALTKILGGLIDFIVGVFTGDWNRAWQGIQNIFRGIWEGLIGIVKGVFNIVIAQVNGIIGSINGVAGAISDATGGAVSFSIPTIPSLAAGATVLPKPGGTLVRLGEAGRSEAVVDEGLLNKRLADLDGSGKVEKHLHYTAAPNESIDAEAKLDEAMERAEALGW